MILEKLAKRYPQLYLTPGENMEEAYRDAAGRGKKPADATLALFEGSPLDRFFTEQTPAGPVDILYLYHRVDFENVIRILARKCRPDVIPATTGAMTLDGLVNWQKIEAHKFAYLAAGHFDWAQEWKRFTADKRNYRDVLIVLSSGPYSGVPASRVDQPEDAWLAISRDIRLYHECTHVICRRLFPQQKDAVWDEITADAIGIRKALGHYDAKLAGIFLGVSADGYVGGRLENYIPADARESLPRLAAEVSALTERIERESYEKQEMDSYEFLMYLQERQSAWGAGLSVR